MQRFFKSLVYIEKHLYEPITIHHIAESAHYSTYHYCRMFRAVVGDSPKEYLRKRRLTETAKLMLKEEGSLLSMALDCQFQSQEAFTRAFKKMFMQTPAQFRKLEQPNKLLFRETLSQDMLTFLKKRISMEPEIILHEETKVVGILSHYDDSEFNLNKIWEPMNAYEFPIPNMSGVNGFGIYEPHHTVDKGFGFSYICAVEVSNFDDVLPGMICRILPCQMYAKFTHKGPLADLSESLKYIWGSWLPKSDYVYVEKTDFELFMEDHDDSNPDNVVYLHIPVKPK